MRQHSARCFFAFHFPALLTTLLAAILLAGCGKETSPDPTPDPTSPAVTLAPVRYRGVDLSFSPELEAAGVRFTDKSQPSSTAAILQSHGANLVRLRLWHTPASGYSNLAEVAAYARRLKQAGFAVLLALHYSDTWCDPGQQATPRAWQGLALPRLQDSVYQYTRRVLRVLAAQQATPAFIQIGNEINAGMLWPQGKVTGEQNWPALAALLGSGLSAVAAEDPQHQIRTVVHYAGPAGAAWFFRHLAQQNVAYDVQALSYYPKDHGLSFPDLQSQLTGLVQEFNKDVLLVETAYPFTLTWNDYTNNIVGTTSQLIPNYPATPAGQLAFLVELRRIVAALPSGHGLGFCYWAPDWVAYKGPQATNGSTWENQTLFDFTNAGLPALDALAQ